ncbi:hypothetical protein Leryth_003584 [Lithospermum erythrorhizon]|uniref:DUF7796 domain-containing protein n=1 Tax=Lithospermum erythrorhizon TaxID=34254 RepID=A0AAV3QXG0_LITER|nr:hypothetical protein Leryth_003584 [Lithospermum erythrorhizon]
MKSLNPPTISFDIPRRIKDLHNNKLLLWILLLPLSLLLFLSLSSPFLSHFKSLLLLSSPPPQPPFPTKNSNLNNNTTLLPKEDLHKKKIGVCLVGGARRFELSGPSIIQRVLRIYPNADLFLHSPLDDKSYKLGLLKDAPRIASVRIFEPKKIPETESRLRVLSAQNSPNGIQGLLQYFQLVEGCLTMIQDYQTRNNFNYDWIIRTRVDGYWSNPLRPENFIRGQYVVPPGSSYWGLNDRFGLGDLNTSIVALSRLSLITQLDQAGLRNLNSESSFKAQLTTQNVSYITKPLPFCIVTDRKYDYPPSRYGVPVAAMSSPGPLNGAKCRACNPVCTGPCVGPIMNGLLKGWSWTQWANGSVQLCDAHSDWEQGWENIFDKFAGPKLAKARKRTLALKMGQCVNDFEKMRNRTAHWAAPSSESICGLGLDL